DALASPSARAITRENSASRLPAPSPSPAKAPPSRESKRLASPITAEGSSWYLLLAEPFQGSRFDRLLFPFTRPTINTESRSARPLCPKPSSSPPFALPSAAPTKVRYAPRAPTILLLWPLRKRLRAFQASTPKKLTT